MRWLLKPLDKGNDAFERLDWKQESERRAVSESGTGGWTDSSPCYPSVLADELGSGQKSEVTAISLPPENYAWLHLLSCTKEVQ